MRWRKPALTLAFLACLVGTKSSATIDDISGGKQTVKWFEVGVPDENVAVRYSITSSSDAWRTRKPLLPVQKQEHSVNAKKVGTSDESKRKDEEEIEDKKQRDWRRELAQDGEESNVPLSTGVIVGISVGLGVVLCLPILLFFFCGCVRCRGSSWNGSATAEAQGELSASDVARASISGAVKLDVRDSVLSDTTRRRFEFA